MRDAAQAGLDAADHDRRIRKRLAHALRIDDHAAIRPLAALAMRCVRIVAPHAPVGRVAIHHRIHVAGRDAEEERWWPKRLEIARRTPIGLRDDTDAKALRLENAADDGHAEAWMVDVSIARHENHVALVPAERVHFLARHRQERRRREPVRPILAVPEELGCR